MLLRFFRDSVDWSNAGVTDESNSRNIAWGPWIAMVLGGAVFLLGAGRFVLRHHFGFTDALDCCLVVPLAGLLLLVLAYVVQHARLVSVIPLFAAGVLVFSSPVFDVGLGLALMGAIASPALRDWRNEK
jgi:hypothetical protein